MPASVPPLGDAEFARLMQGLGSFERTPRIAVACSGGADSLALAVLAHRWAEARDGRLTALIVEHGLRPGSVREAAETAGRLEALGIAAEILPWCGTKPATGVQAAARAARYALLEGWCRAHGVLHLLTGHHLDDQAETLLMRLARGGDGDGLAAMPAVRELDHCRLLRPLLAVRRGRLAATLEAAGLGWVDDPSNDDPRYERVRVRQALAAGGLDPAGLAASAAGHARARAALEVAAARLVAEAASLSPAGFARLDPAALAAAPEEVARRALARLLAAIGGRPYAPAAAPLGRLLARIGRDRTRARGSLAGCRLATADDGRLVVAREARNLPASRPLAPGDRFRWDGRFEIACPVSLRTGLRLAPLGAGGAAPHLPAAARAAAPALFDADGETLAVVPMRHPPAELPRILFRPAIALSGAGFYAAGTGETA